MARPGGLKRRLPLAALVLGVLAVHLAGLRWVAQQTAAPSALHRMPEALFTRVLAPETPPPPPETPALAAPPPAPLRPAITTLQAQPARAAADAPEPAAPVEAAPVEAAPAEAAPTETASSDPEPEAEPEVAAEAEAEQETGVAQAQLAPAAPVEAAPVEAAPVQPSASEAPLPEPPIRLPPVPRVPDTLAATEDAPARPATAAAPPVQAPAALPDPAVVDRQAPPESAAQAGVGSDPAARDHWPRDSRVLYALTGHFRGPLYGRANVLWQREGARYEARVTLEISLAGTRTLTSQGDVTPAGLLPRVYEEAWRGRRRAVRLDERQLVFESGAAVPRPAGVQDTASQFVELGWRFASGRERLEVGRAVDVWLARPGAVDLWTYDIVERETLATPRLGAIEAYRLKPRPIARPRGNITAEIWFAPSLQYLPARIRVNLGEEAWVDLIVEAVEQR